MSEAPPAPPGIAEIRAAARRIAPHAHRTPVLTSSALDERLDAKLWFKCESFQRAGAFKFRGACNAVWSLPEAALAAGVATHSSGNHAAALALAARLRGCRAIVVMPENASRAKRAAVEGYGARVVTCASTQRAREDALAAIVANEGCEPVAPFDDHRVIAGQGTAALELLEEVPDLDLVLAPVGGGGLLAGTAIASAAVAPHVRVVGVEPTAADDAWRSFRSGAIEPLGPGVTIADGLRTNVGRLTFPVILTHVSDIVTVSEEGIVAAMRLVWERMKIIIEPSSAVPVAALLEGALPGRGRRIGIIVSGGNVDLDALPWR